MIKPSSRSPGDDSTGRRSRGGLLSFGRGAAVMMLALGINGVLAGSISRYDPSYVDVAAVAVVAWFEGWLPALVAGAVALAAYELWFSAAPTTAGSLIVPSLSALAVISLVTVARRMTGSPRIAERPEVTHAWVREGQSQQGSSSHFTPDLDPRGSAPESDAGEVRAARDEGPLREDLARAEADRDALKSSMQAAMIRHQEESSKLKVERVRAMEEARQATQALSSAKESLSTLEGALTLARRAAEEAQRLADERAAAMLEGEAKRGADEARLRDALDDEKERVRQAAAKIDSLAHDLALAAVERDRWQRTTTEIREEAQRRIQELSDQCATASAAAGVATNELENERDRSARARTTIAELERAAERTGSELATVRKAVDDSARERDRLASDLEAAGGEIDRWHQEYSRAADDVAQATAALTERSLVQSELEQLRLEHGHVSRSLEAARGEGDQLRAERAEVARELAIATEALSALGPLKSNAEELRAENAGLGRLLQIARDEAEHLRADHANVSRMLEEVRADAENTREQARQTGEQLERAAAEATQLAAVRSEADQLRLEKIALMHAVDSATSERDSAQARAAMAASEIAAASETRAALTESRGIAEQLRSENRRLATTLGAAEREAARLRADSTHYADEVIGLRARLERVSAASSEAEGLRGEVSRLTRELEDAIGRSDSLAKEQSLLEERGRSDVTQLLAGFEQERKELREALDSAARLNVELTSHKEESQRWQAEAQRLAAQIEVEVQTAAEESARATEAQRRLRQELDAEWAAKLEASASSSADQQREIGERDSLLKEMRARLQSATEQIDRLGQELAAAYSAQSTLDDAAQLRETMTAAVAASASAAAARVEELETELAGVRADLVDAGRESRETRAALEEQRQAFTEAEKMWDDKLLRIVEGMTTDHENDLGEAMIERESAKAELRLATNQVARLEAALNAAEVARDDVSQEWKRRSEQVLAAIIQRETTIRAAAEREVARLQVELEVGTEAYQKLEASAREEKLRYEEAESSWGNKLQQIVANVTDDYEADLGEAITTREAARAELRSLSTDLRRAQQKLAAAEETQRALVAEAARREAEIEQQVSAATARSVAPEAPQADGGALRKKLLQAEQINSAWGDAFTERESELKREAAGQMAEMESQLDRLRKSEAGLTEAFRAAAADAQLYKHRLDEERSAAEHKATERDEAFRQGLLHAQQQWEDRFDSVVSESEKELRQLRSQIREQESELASLREHGLEERGRREQKQSEELRIARQLELAQQSDEERRSRSEVLQFAEDARSLLMGGSPEPASSPALSDPFPEAAAQPTGSATDETSSASDDFLAIVTRLSGNS